MYQSTENQILLPSDFFLPFGGQLKKDNRPVQLAFLIPWWKVEERYAKQLKSSRLGQQDVSVRVALGALIIQHRLGHSDRETVRQITENPYLPYFIGLPKFQEEPPFHPSLMTHFRKRLGEGKRLYGLGLIKARLAQTSATVIAMQMLVMNLEKRLRLLFSLFLCLELECC